jgi:hypothetical protein
MESIPLVRCRPHGCKVQLKAGMGVTMSHQTIFELLAAPYPAELSEAVNARLAQGWQLFGHPFAHAGEFFQAVVGKVAEDKSNRKASEDGPAEGDSG